MAFYNCNGISSSGGNGGGISSLGKIEEYGYTLNEAKDVLSFDAIDKYGIDILGVTNQYIFYRASNKIFKISFEDWSVREVTDIPETVVVDGVDYTIYYSMPYYCGNGDLMIVYRSSYSSYRIYRYNNTEIIYTGCTINTSDDLVGISDRYVYVRYNSGSNPSFMVYNIIGNEDNTSNNLKCTFSSNSFKPVDIDNDTFITADLSSYKSFKLTNYTPIYDTVKFSFERSLSYYGNNSGFIAGHYVYYFVSTGLIRINPRIKHVTFNPYILPFSYTEKIWMVDHIFYDIRHDKNYETYTIHKHADMVNKLTLYLKEGNEIFCDTNVLHPITSNLIKSVNGYKCTSNGKCELWFREDPEELTYSII